MKNTNGLKKAVELLKKLETKQGKGVIVNFGRRYRYSETVELLKVLENILGQTKLEIFSSLDQLNDLREKVFLSETNGQEIHYALEKTYDVSHNPIFIIPVFMEDEQDYKTYDVSNLFDSFFIRMLFFIDLTGKVSGEEFKLPVSHRQLNRLNEICTSQLSVEEQKFLIKAMTLDTEYISFLLKNYNS